MKHILILLLCMLTWHVDTPAQSVTKTSHRTALKNDVQTTGTMTVRKPDYICIATDGGKDLLMMDGTTFTMTMGGKKHVTDSRKNPQFTTFHTVLKAIINGQPVPQGDDTSVTSAMGRTTIVIQPTGKKKRQLFTSFVLTIDNKTKSICTLRMNGRRGDYTEYSFK